VSNQICIFVIGESTVLTLRKIPSGLDSTGRLRTPGTLGVRWIDIWRSVREELRTAYPSDLRSKGGKYLGSRLLNEIVDLNWQLRDTITDWAVTLEQSIRYGYGSSTLNVIAGAVKSATSKSTSASASTSMTVAMAGDGDGQHTQHHLFDLKKHLHLVLVSLTAMSIGLSKLAIRSQQQQLQQSQNHAAAAAANSYLSVAQSAAGAVPPSPSLMYMSSSPPVLASMMALSGSGTGGTSNNNDSYLPPDDRDAFLTDDMIYYKNAHASVSRLVDSVSLLYESSTEMHRFFQSQRDATVHRLVYVHRTANTLQLSFFLSLTSCACLLDI
jgi:hypothetical protein